MNSLSKDRQVDRYRLEMQIGEGGMAVVWRAHHILLSHTEPGAPPSARVPRALKFLRGTDRSAEFEVARERFRREAQILARVRHPNVIEIVDYFEEDGVPTLVMPFLEGQTLHERLDQQGAMSLPDALRLARQVADALHHVHSFDIIHRDLTTANIFIEQDDSGERAKLIDFGIARPLDSRTSRPLTSAGRTLGSVEFMSPEQLQKGDLDQATDLWAFGVVLFRMLTNKYPFVSDSPSLLGHEIIKGSPNLAELTECRLSDLVPFFEKTFRKDAKSRFRTAKAMIRSLSEVGGTRGIIPSPTLELADSRTSHRPSQERDSGSRDDGGGDATDGPTTPVIGPDEEDKPSTIPWVPVPLSLAPATVSQAARVLQAAPAGASEARATQTMDALPPKTDAEILVLRVSFSSQSHSGSRDDDSGGATGGPTTPVRGSDAENKPSTIPAVPVPLYLAPATVPQAATVPEAVSAGAGEAHATQTMGALPPKTDAEVLVLRVSPPGQSDAMLPAASVPTPMRRALAWHPFVLPSVAIFVGMVCIGFLLAFLSGFRGGSASASPTTGTPTALAALDASLPPTAKTESTVAAAGATGTPTQAAASATSVAGKDDVKVQPGAPGGAGTRTATPPSKTAASPPPPPPPSQPPPKSTVKFGQPD